MKQIHHPYWEWEDYQNGMWSNSGSFEEDVRSACELLGSPDRLENSMRNVVRCWPKSAEQNLTDFGQNRRAWLGQAACCFESGIPEQCTRLAWWRLDLEQQIAANTVADTVIQDWMEDRSGAQALFGR